VIIHMAFVLSGVFFALMDRIASGSAKHWNSGMIIVWIDMRAYNKAMKKFSSLYKKPFFACIFCVIYTALSYGIAIFSN
jgi:hypothetical protein